MIALFITFFFGVVGSFSPRRGTNNATVSEDSKC